MGDDLKPQPLTVTEAGAIHAELGRLCGLVEVQRDLTIEARDEAKSTRKLIREELTKAREDRQSELAALSARLPCLTIAACPAKKPPTSPGMPALTRADLDNTERTVLERSAEQVEAAITERLQRGVEEVLEKRAADAERAASERREQTRREQAEQAATLAAGLAVKAEQDKARWARVQWIAGLVATVLGSGTVLSYCNTSARLDADRQAVVRALKEQPAPVVVKVPTPVPVPAVKEE